jgi:hypothetical protein
MPCRREWLEACLRNIVGVAYTHAEDLLPPTTAQERQRQHAVTLPSDSLACWVVQQVQFSTPTALGSPPQVSCAQGNPITQRKIGIILRTFWWSRGRALGQPSQLGIPCASEPVLPFEPRWASLLVLSFYYHLISLYHACWSCVWTHLAWPRLRHRGLSRCRRCSLLCLPSSRCPRSRVRTGTSAYLRRGWHLPPAFIPSPQVS